MNHRVFDAYGQMTSQTNAAVDFLFGFTGRPFDEATGLQNNWNRWHEPAVGRWLSQDPLGLRAGDTNENRYVGNGTTKLTDPSGLTPPTGLPIVLTGPDYWRILAPLHELWAARRAQRLQAQWMSNPLGWKPDEFRKYLPAAADEEKFQEQFRRGCIELAMIRLGDLDPYGQPHMRDGAIGFYNEQKARQYMKEHPNKKFHLIAISPGHSDPLLPEQDEHEKYTDPDIFDARRIGKVEANFSFYTWLETDPNGNPAPCWEGMNHGWLPGLLSPGTGRDLREETARIYHSQTSPGTKYFVLVPRPR